MQNILITGGAGFIGANFVRYLLKAEPQAHIVNLDALTYAGSLENLRDLSDRSGVPIVFVGTDQILYRLQQREQFASRVSQVVAFKALGRDEVKMIVGELTGLGLDDDVADKLVAASDGYFRDLVVLLSHLSRAAKASGAKALNPEMVTQVARKAVLRMAA